MIKVKIRRRQDGEWINEDYASRKTLQDLLKMQDEILKECKEMYGKVKVLRRIRSLEPDYNRIGNPYQALRAYDEDLEDCMWIDIIRVAKRRKP